MKTNAIRCPRAPLELLALCDMIVGLEPRERGLDLASRASISLRSFGPGSLASRSRSCSFCASTFATVDIGSWEAAVISCARANGFQSGLMQN